MISVKWKLSRHTGEFVCVCVSKKGQKVWGFLADYFIKPPVGIRFTFRHPIHLCKLIFQPQVGQQSCQTFEIWASQDHQNERCEFKYKNICIVCLSSFEELVSLFSNEMNFFC